MTATEILAAFPLVTADDLRELRTGEAVMLQATATDGTVCMIAYFGDDDGFATEPDDGDTEFTVTDNF